LLSIDDSNYGHNVKTLSPELMAEIEQMESLQAVEALKISGNSQMSER
jgi:hypothetical protein